MNLKEILKKIKPDEKEEKDMKSLINELLKVAKENEEIYPMICGSVSKDTWLSNKNEIDLFLIFNPMVSKKKLEEDGLRIAKNIVSKLKGKYTIAYSEHPYLRASIKWKERTYQIDIVPAYNIEDPEKIKSAVDRTPHHVRFIKQNLKNTDDVRLLKQFCIANKIYGADVKTQGFSGYLCELLILYFKDFNNLVKNASKWRAGVIITFDKTLDQNFILNKFKTPLIVIDPIDKNRNVSAAVSTEVFYRFVKTCKEFVDRPRKDFFFPPKAKPYSISKISNEMERRGTKWHMIKFKKPDVTEDILYPQMRRFVNTLEKIFNENDFKVLRKDFWINDECIVLFEMKNWIVPKIDKKIGPSVYSKHAENFLKHYKNKNIFIENNKWVVEVERKFSESTSLLQSILKKTQKELMESGVPSKIAPLLQKSQLLIDRDIIKAISSLPEDFRVFMKEWFEKNLNIV